MASQARAIIQPDIGCTHTNYTVSGSGSIYIETCFLNSGHYYS